ncbi:MAG: PAC2 family protein [Nitrososphaerota archaeon]|nr:PAC2 family protein [Candidatus Calditenuis fumarioli]
MVFELIEEHGSIARGRKVLIDVGPSPGAVGLVSATVLLESRKGEKVLRVFSPHFPQVSLIDSEGVSSLPVVELHQLSDGLNAIVLTRNFIVESTEAGESVARSVIERIGLDDVELLMVVTSGRLTGTGDVYAASNDPAVLRRAIESGAKVLSSVEALPVDRLTSSLMRRAMTKGIKTLLLLADTEGILPDFRSAKRLLQVMSSLLQIQIDTSKLDEEIARQQAFLKQMEEAFTETGETERREGGPTYIG